jgi:hypothetical protein
MQRDIPRAAVEARMAESLKCVLNEANFADLVAGNAVKPANTWPPGQPVEIILSDIGWDRMMEAVWAAMDAS